MKFFRKMSDGGKDSGVTGYFLVGIKSLFSIVLLHFRNGTREAYHSHAFNALTLWIKGRVIEHRLYHRGDPDISCGCGVPPYEVCTEYASGRVKYTGRDNMHKVESLGETWALSIRGPWANTWQEFKAGKFITLTNGRRVVSTEPA